MITVLTDIIVSIMIRAIADVLPEIIEMIVKRSL
jgi:hypothetical protein